MDAILAAFAFAGIACVALFVWLSIDAVCPYQKLNLLDQSALDAVNLATELEELESHNETQKAERQASLGLIKALQDKNAAEMKEVIAQALIKDTITSTVSKSSQPQQAIS